MNAESLVDLGPVLRMGVLGMALAAGPLVWVWLRHASAEPQARLRTLIWLTLLLTFDLVLFGAFTRLTDSGLGCPDWPGCYGSASPIGASAHIDAAAAAMPTGPVTPTKAWIEMVHRYLATGVGVLVIVIAAASWWLARRGRLAISPWWATVTLVWVCLQGLFGALTVTLGLYPAIVTLHLLGGMGLLALLAGLAERTDARQPPGRQRPLALPRGLLLATGVLAGVVVAQITLGGWVSTNYAVLACSDFPRCQGRWWPHMDFASGFAVFRALGAGKDGGFLPVEALTAIHYSHRVGACVTLAAMAVVAGWLHATGEAEARRWAARLLALGVWQLSSGLGNVLLGWPLWAAVAHTAGAAALVVLLTVLILRALQGRAAALPMVSRRAGSGATAAS